MMYSKKIVSLVMLIVIVFLVGCSKKKDANEFTVLIHMLPKQEKYFKNEILASFEKENNCKINTATFDVAWHIETALKLEKAKKPDDRVISVVKVPFEFTRVLVDKGYIEPIDSIIFDESLLSRDLAEYNSTALGFGYSNNHPYYLPRKLETRVLFYLKSKVEEAIKLFPKVKNELNILLKKQNSYGLPNNYVLEKDPNLWDYYDIFVVGYIWSKTDYFGTKMGRFAHRGAKYEGTALGLVDRSISFGATDDDILKMNSNPVTDMFLWEAQFVKNGIFNPGMYNDPWDGRGLYNALQSGKIFMTYLQQIDCFNVHGWEEDLEMQGYLKEPNDMGLAVMPKAVSFELDKDGNYLRTGNRQTTTGGWWWGIPRTAPNKKLAYDLIRHITSHDVQAKECVVFGMMPVRKDIINNLEQTFEFGWVGEVFRVTVNQINNNSLKTVPLIKEYGDIGKNYIEAWYDLCVNKYGKSDDIIIDYKNMSNLLSERYVPKQKELLKEKYPVK